MRKSQLAPPIVPVLLAAALVLFSASAASGAVQLAIGQKESLVDAMEPTVAVKADGNRVVVQVLSASYNCCHVADARLVVEEGRVEIRERNAGTICLSFLPCYFDVTYTISRLAPATYEVFLFDEESTLLAAETVEVGAIVDQPECTDEAVEKEKVVASATHDSIVVEHRAVRLQSCLIFAPEVEIDGASIRITARDASPVPCRSVCYYDLAVEIPGLRPGTYAVRYIGFDGQLALETDVAIAPPQVVVTQAAIPRTAEPPEERISVFVEGDDVIVEYVAIVQQCCLDLDAWAELRQDRDPGSLDVRTQDNGPPCDCIGSFIIRIEVLDLLPGTYRATCGLGEGASGDVTIGPAGPEEVFFLRGFVSIDDWEITISDAIQILGHLFLGAPPELPCHDAADANDDGKLDLTDAVYLLGYLFLGGPEQIGRAHV